MTHPGTYMCEAAGHRANDITRTGGENGEAGARLGLHVYRKVGRGYVGLGKSTE